MSLNFALEVFLGGATLSHSNEIKFPSWISQNQRISLGSLVESNPNIIKTLNSADFQDWATMNSLESNLPPSTQYLVPEERLILIKIFQADNLIESIKDYLTIQLGLDTNFPQSSTLKDLWSIMIKYQNTPVLFISTQGIDPEQELALFVRIFRNRIK